MLRPISAFCSLVLLLALQPRTAFPQAKSGLDSYIVESGPILLRHVRIIYGRQQPVSEDYAVLIRDGRISWLGPDAQAPDPKGAKIFDETGNSVMPGLVMLHEHLFTTSASSGPQPFLQQQGFTFPKMYLAAGVTTIRTAGSVEPYMDIEIKRQSMRESTPGLACF
jgi:imidazolonepropionase-like amidohydrolase